MTSADNYLPLLPQEGSGLSLPMELLLISLRPNGSHRNALQVDTGIAGAALIELVLAEKIDLVDKTVILLDDRPTGRASLDSVLDDIAADPRPRKAKRWIWRHRAKMPALVGEELAHLCLVDHKRPKVLGIFSYHRFPPRDPASAVEVTERLWRAMSGDDPDDRTIILAMLVQAVALSGRILRGIGWGERRRRLRQLQDQPWRSESVAQAVKAIKQVIAEITAAATAAASS